MFRTRFFLSDNFQVNTEQKNSITVKLKTGAYSEISFDSSEGSRNATIANILLIRAKTALEKFSSAMNIVSEVVITAKGIRLN